MAPALLDINVMMALAWPTHVHHGAARRWFAANRDKGWATCLHTQMGFLRLSIQPAVVKTVITFEHALNALARSLQAPEHEFWALDYPVVQILPEIRSRLIGHQQISDALLLDLAIRHSGRLATFDRRIVNLLAADSVNRPAVELIAA